MHMAKFKMISLTTPKPGREAEFHDWYQNTHLPELVSFAELYGAQRYQLVAKLMGTDTNPFLAIYDLECDDPMTFLGAMGEASTSGKLTQSDTADMSVNYTALFSEYGERVEKA
jgi:hypothetical protein